MSLKQSFSQQHDTIQQKEIDPLHLQSFGNYVQRLKQSRRLQELYLEQQETVCRQIQEVLRQALVKQKSLEKLKEKEHKKYLKEIEKDEQNFLEEMAITRAYFQKKKERQRRRQKQALQG